MCKTYVPRYRCGHVGDAYEECEADETFHGICEGCRDETKPVKHMNCCSEQCCWAAIERKKEVLRRIERDRETSGEKSDEEELQGARDAIVEDREHHEKVCRATPQEARERFHAWACKKETDTAVNKMWRRRFWFEWS